MAIIRKKFNDSNVRVKVIGRTPTKSEAGHDPMIALGIEQLQEKWGLKDSYKYNLTKNPARIEAERMFKELTKAEEIPTPNTVTLEGAMSYMDCVAEQPKLKGTKRELKKLTKAVIKEGKLPSNEEAEAYNAKVVSMNTLTWNQNRMEGVFKNAKRRGETPAPQQFDNIHPADVPKLLELYKKYYRQIPRDVACIINAYQR